jgi:hypothetical protein
MIQNIDNKVFWEFFPSREELLTWFKTNGTDKTLSVNAHLHTPYSFSAFRDIRQALDIAVNEDVSVMGINDFYTTDGYGEWAAEAKSRGIFPLFNIEYISLNKADQLAGLKVNDPGNPGRTYLSGKGLAYPTRMEEPYASALASVRYESNKHVAGMCFKLNQLLQQVEAGFSLDFEEIKETMTKGMVRERHLARALREKVDSCYITPDYKKYFYSKLFGGKALVSDPGNDAAVENELRGNLLKAGGPAFIPEPPEAFLESEMVCRMILNQGGIPTYPFLADDANGKFTHFEESKEAAAKTLRERNIWSVEFITTRNSLEVLEDYVLYFQREGFLVSLGSEHNTPAMEPVELFARKGTVLSPALKEANYRGACVLAAHQYLLNREGTGYLDQSGKPLSDKQDDFVELGKALIGYLNKQSHA